MGCFFLPRIKSIIVITLIFFLCLWFCSPCINNAHWLLNQWGGIRTVLCCCCAWSVETAGFRHWQSNESFREKKPGWWFIMEFNRRILCFYTHFIISERRDAVNLRGLDVYFTFGREDEGPDSGGAKVADKIVSLGWIGGGLHRLETGNRLQERDFCVFETHFPLDEIYRVKSTAI